MEFCKRIELGSNAVQDDILSGVGIEFLGEVGVNLQEFASTVVSTLLVHGLELKRREQVLEPLKRGNVLADPDKFDTLEAQWWVGALPCLPDVLEDRSPRSDTNTGSDEDSNLVVKHILSGSSVRAVNSQSRKPLAVLQGNLKLAVGIQVVAEHRRSSANSLAESLCKVTNLADVNRDIGIRWARGDGKGMPLVLGNFRDVEEEPLAGLVLERGLLELDFHGVEGMSDNLGNLGLSGGTDFSVDALQEVENTDPEIEAPSLVSDAVLPKVLVVEGGEGLGSITHEASDSVGVESQEKDEGEVVSIPEGLEALLANLVVRSRVHEKHAQQHDMASDSTRLGVVNLERSLGTELGLFYVEEAVNVRIPLWFLSSLLNLLDVMGEGVNDGKEEHRVGSLTMEPALC